MSAAANGATNPKSRTLIATANEISERDQPNASSSGTMRTDGADLNPAVAIKVRNVTPAAIHAGCNLRVLVIEHATRLLYR